MRALFTAAAVVTFVVGVVGTHVLSKKAGRKEAISSLRDNQLDQAQEELEGKMLIIKESDLEGLELAEAITSVSDWYVEEKQVINSMYDEILNNT